MSTSHDQPTPESKPEANVVKKAALKRPYFSYPFDDPQSVLFCITTDYVRQFCEDQGICPLSDEELEDLSVFLYEDMDRRYDLIGEAIDRLRHPEDYPRNRRPE